MVVAMEAFLEPLEAWAKAIREGDFVRAKHHAEHLIQSGELLAIHPDFQRCFKDQCRDCDPHEALVLLGQFLQCAADGKAGIQRRPVKSDEAGS